MEILDMEKAVGLSLRVFNNKYDKNKNEEVKKKFEDEKAIKALCSKVFPESGETPSESELHKFNNVVVRTAEVVAQPDLKKMVDFLASSEHVPASTETIVYKKPIPSYVKTYWASTGSSVSVKRVQTGEKVPINIDVAQTAIQHNYLTDSKTQVEEYRALVMQVANMYVQLMYDKLMELIELGVNASIIPTSQIVNGASLSIAQFNKVANSVGRRTDSKPIFIADRALINSFAEKKTSSIGTNMPDNLKFQYYNMELTNLGSADAIPLTNKFVSNTSDKTHYEVNRGYMLGSAGTTKPMHIALAGGLTQETEKDAEYGRFKILLRQRLGIVMLYAGNIGVVTDTAVTL